ncbi:MAG: iron uptake transporter deferrochelatase/peroxidase subunit [Actinomycetales bacterium]
MSGDLTGSRDKLSRRGLLGALGAGAAGVGLVGAGALSGATDLPAAGTGRADLVEFTGEHQAGIATDVQANLHFAAFDVTTTDRGALIALLQEWTAAARELTLGLPVGGPTGVDGGPAAAPPLDSGEAYDTPAHRLTITVGFGPSLFDDRFGLAARRPTALVDLPHFARDDLDPSRCGGDLAVQACADDPQVAVHAIRNLSRIAAGRAAVRWAQLGYGKAASTDRSEPTPRNLFGFKDGTANPSGRDIETLNAHVWVQPGDDDGPRAWMSGGSYLVARRIEMMIETWDRASLAEQERLVGRTKGVGAPLGSTGEFDPVVPARLPAASHVALAHPSRFGGAQILRRGYNFVDGADGFGHLSAGLFFLAYQRDPRSAFVPMQESLARDDAMMDYLRHTGSGIWAVPPGVGATGYWGQGLFA